MADENNSNNATDDTNAESVNPATDDDDTIANLVSMIVSEFECPVCLQPMIGQSHLPVLCPNGHPCCSSCAARVRRTCPVCRCSNIRWTRCLPMERIGSSLVEHGLVSEPAERTRERN